MGETGKSGERENYNMDILYERRIEKRKEGKEEGGKKVFLQIFKTY